MKMYVLVVTWSPVEKLGRREELSLAEWNSLKVMNSVWWSERFYANDDADEVEINEWAADRYEGLYQLLNLHYPYLYEVK